MENTTQFKLVKGIFNATESKALIFRLINSKIQFHQLEVFSLKERNTGDINYHNNRVKELIEERERIKLYLDQAEKNNLLLTLDGTITIQLAK